MIPKSNGCKTITRKVDSTFKVPPLKLPTDDGQGASEEPPVIPPRSPASTFMKNISRSVDSLHKAGIPSRNRHSSEAASVPLSLPSNHVHSQGNKDSEKLNGSRSYSEEGHVMKTYLGSQSAMGTRESWKDLSHEAIGKSGKYNRIPNVNEY